MVEDFRYRSDNGWKQGDRYKSSFKRQIKDMGYHVGKHIWTFFKYPIGILVKPGKVRFILRNIGSIIHIEPHYWTVFVKIRYRIAA